MAFVGRPEAESKATIAHGPGSGETVSPRLRHSRVTRKPGSLMPGVPASVMSAMTAPAATRSAMVTATSFSLCSW